jgi:outer membrane lipoprotein-sorting protein
MFELNRQESEFAALVERLNVDDAPRPAHRDALRARALAAYREQASRPIPSFWQETIRQGRAIMQRPSSRYAAGFAAIVLVLAGWVFLHEEQKASAAFYEFAKSLVTAKSARFKMEVKSAGQPAMKFDSLYLAPARFRQSTPDLVNISDMRVGKIVTLRPEQKTAFVVNLVGRGEANGTVDIFDRLQKLIEDKSRSDESLKPVGEKIINGRRALGFRDDTPFATLTIWGDPETGLPVQIDTVMNGVPRAEVTWSDFELNVDLDESLFDTTPPAGYEVQAFEMDASPYKERDLIETLRLASEINDGKFPDSIDTAASQQLFVKSIRSRKDAPDKESMEKFMQLGAKIGRGFSFALQLPKTANAHYAGKGVKRDTPGTPIFWYRPEGAKTYRVVMADLTVSDTDRPPQVPGAVPIFNSVPAASPKIPDQKEN